MKIDCPHCAKDFEVEASSVIPKSQVLYMELKCESELFAAKTIGKAIIIMEALQRGVADNMGIKVTVFIKSIELEPGKIKIGFTIISNSQQEDAK